MTEKVRLGPSIEEEWDDETRALVMGAGGLNIFRTVAHHPKLLKRWLVFGGHVLVKSTVPARERELLILRTGWRCGSEYEFGQHTVIGAQAGLTEDEIRRIAREELDGWAPDDAMLLRAADELVGKFDLTQETYDSLGEQWSTQQVLDIVFTVGQYMMVSMMLKTFGVQLEPGTPGWPSEDVGRV